MTQYQRFVLSIVVMIIMTACGGGVGTTSPPSPTPTSYWTKQLGAGAYTATMASTTATDADGNIYVAGSTSGNLDGNTLSSTDAIDFYLTKYNKDGIKLYTQQMGAGTDTLANATATDADGNVYVAGSTTGDLDGNTLSGANATDFFLTKYDINGNRLYTQQMGTGSDTYTAAYGTATDANGNVYVTGSTNGGLDGNMQSGVSTTDFFLTKYNPSGTKLYTKQMGTGSVLGSVYGYSTTTDLVGNVYVAGVTFAGLDGNISSGGLDLFLTKYDSSGNKVYTTLLGPVGAGTLLGYISTATDISGNVYVVGVTESGLDGNQLAGVSDLFLTKYNISGAKLYTKQLGVANVTTTGNSVATDTIGNVYVAGFTHSGLDGNMFSGGASDCFITKYDATGLKLFTKQMGAVNMTTLGTAIATDASDNVYVAGYVYGSSASHLDGNTLSGLFAYDFFLAKYDSTGLKQ